MRAVGADTCGRHRPRPPCPRPECNSGRVPHVLPQEGRPYQLLVPPATTSAPGGIAGDVATGASCAARRRSSPCTARPTERGRVVRGFGARPRHRDRHGDRQSVGAGPADRVGRPPHGPGATCAAPVTGSVVGPSSPAASDGHGTTTDACSTARRASPPRPPRWSAGPRAADAAPRGRLGPRTGSPVSLWGCAAAGLLPSASPNRTGRSSSAVRCSRPHRRAVSMAAPPPVGNARLEGASPHSRAPSRARTRCAGSGSSTEQESWPSSRQAVLAASPVDQASGAGGQAGEGRFSGAAR